MRRLFLILTIVLPNIICAQDIHWFPELDTMKIVAKNKIAFLVANTNYHNDSLDLKTPSNDMVLLSKSLEKLQFDIISKENVTLNELREIVVEFQDTIHSYDFGVFYYAGHGFENEKGDPYIIPVDVSDLKSLEKNSESVTDILNILGSFNTKCLFILDACRNEGNNGIGEPKKVKKQAVNIKLAYSTSPGYRASDEVFMHQSTLYASALSYYFEKAGKLTIQQIFNNIYEIVMKESDGLQRPTTFYGQEVNKVRFK